LNAQTAHMRSKVAYNLLWILGAASIALGGILFLFVGRQLAFPLLGLGIFYLAWPILVFPIRVKRDYKKQTQLMGPRVLTTSEAGIRFKGDNFESETQRSLFGKMRETKQVFMLYVGDRSFEMLPKRAFSPSEQEEFRELVSQHLPNK